MKEEHASLIRKSFTGLYALDQSPDGLKAYQMGLANPYKFVLKPQREGGGNNYYGEDVRKMLEGLSIQERNGYILMDLIRPSTMRNVMVRGGKAVENDVVSELGIYGIWVSKSGVVHMNCEGGQLLRTKSSDSNEGGVATGYSVLSSVLRV